MNKKFCFLVILLVGIQIQIVFAMTTIKIEIDTKNRILLPDTKLTMVFRIRNPGQEDLLYQYPYWVKKIDQQKTVLFSPDQKLFNYIHKNRLSRPLQNNSLQIGVILEPVLFTDIGKAAISGGIEPDGYLDSDDIRANLLFTEKGSLNFQSSGYVLLANKKSGEDTNEGQQNDFYVINRKSQQRQSDYVINVQYTGPQPNNIRNKHHHFIIIPAIKQGVNLCTAASMEMLLSHYQIQKNQYQIATEMCALKFNPKEACVYRNGNLLGIYYTNSYKIDAYLNQLYPRFTNSFKTANEKGAIEVTLVKDSITLLKQQLIKNHPVMVRTCYSNQVPCVVHFRLVTGFDDGEKLVYINDPANGLTALTVSYQDFFDKLWLVAEQPNGSRQSTRFMVVHQ